jgi:hypothetical protein
LTDYTALRATQLFRANGTYSGTRLFRLEKMQIDHDQKVIRNAAVHDGEMRRRKRRARCARVVDARVEAIAPENDRRVDLPPPRPLVAVATSKRYKVHFFIGAIKTFNP